MLLLAHDLPQQTLNRPLAAVAPALPQQTASSSAAPAAMTDEQAGTVLAGNEAELPGMIRGRMKWGSIDRWRREGNLVWIAVVANQSQVRRKSTLLFPWRYHYGNNVPVLPTA